MPPFQNFFDHILICAPPFKMSGAAPGMNNWVQPLKYSKKWGFGKSHISNPKIGQIADFYP